MKKLNNKQEIFCIEYLKSFNATQSALKAGYSKKTSYQIGHNLLKKIEIQNRIKALKLELKEVMQIDSFDILHRLKCIAFKNEEELKDSPFKGSDVIKALSEIIKILDIDRNSEQNVPIIKIDVSNLEKIKPIPTKDPKSGKT